MIHAYDYYTTTNTNDDPALNGGAVAGYLQFERVRQGEAGTQANGREFKLKQWQYISRTVGGGKIYPVWKEIAYQNVANGGSDPAETDYAYTWQGDFQIEKRITTWPVIPTGQNGSGTADTREEILDTYGRVIWQKDERGVITNFTYDISTAGLIQRIDDFKKTSTTTYPVGWLSPNGMNLVIDYEITRADA